MPQWSCCNGWLLWTVTSGTHGTWNCNPALPRFPCLSAPISQLHPWCDQLVTLPGQVFASASAKTLMVARWMFIRIAVSGPLGGGGKNLDRFSHTPLGGKGLDCWKLKVLGVQTCPTLCDPMGCNLPGFSVHGIFQARILDWVAIPRSPGGLPDPGIEPRSPALQADSLPSGLFSGSRNGEAMAGTRNIEKRQ